MALNDHFSKISLIVFVAQFLVRVKGESISDVQSVLNNVFISSNYNKMIRGVHDQTRTVKVNVTFFIASIVHLNEIEEALGVM